MDDAGLHHSFRECSSYRVGEPLKPIYYCYQYILHTPVSQLVITLSQNLAP